MESPDSSPFSSSNSLLLAPTPLPYEHRSRPTDFGRQLLALLPHLGLVDLHEGSLVAVLALPFDADAAAEERFEALLTADGSGLTAPFFASLATSGSTTRRARGLAIEAV